MHYEVSLFTKDDDLRAILIARLSDLGFDGFEEQDEALLAFVPENDFDAAALEEVIDTSNLSFAIKEVQQENWNAIWERDFHPVVVGDFCTVRASFHEVATATRYEIIITPKMSFGTGHHATTKLMIESMSEMAIEGRKVLDFGTGTGILAILAEKLGAEHVLAIDNDEWSVNNSLENIALNDSHRILIRQGSLDIVSEQDLDLILANINRHILLQYMNDMGEMLKTGGLLLLSGILSEDVPMITDAARKADFQLLSQKEDTNWMSLLFSKL